MRLTVEPFAAMVFDCDGTVIDSELVQKRAGFSALRNLGYEPTDAFAHRVLGLPETVIKPYFLQEFGDNFPFVEYRHAFVSSVKHSFATEGIPLKPGAVEALDWCEENGVATAMATMRSTADVCDLLTRAKLISKFSYVLGSDQVAPDKGKPAPEIYLLASRKLRIDPSLCLAVEDSFPGVRSAHAAKMRTYMIPDLMPPTDEIRALTAGVFSNMKSLIDHLGGRDYIRSHETRVQLTDLFAPLTRNSSGSRVTPSYFDK